MADVILVRDGPNLKAKFTVIDASDMGVTSGITVNFSVRRKSDDFYFDGAAFTNTTEVQLAGSHDSNGLYILTLVNAYNKSEKNYDVRVEVTGTETLDFMVSQSFIEAYLNDIEDKLSSVELGETSLNKEIIAKSIVETSIAALTEDSNSIFSLLKSNEQDVNLVKINGMDTIDGVDIHTALKIQKIIDMGNFLEGMPDPDKITFFDKDGIPFIVFQVTKTKRIKTTGP